ncbi:MAG: hypothetical protein JWN04_24, partial [Myxococcaceae bacterium]|nr:hypothetical protein [Myxococcaceae bacterium]
MLRDVVVSSLLALTVLSSAH